MQGNAQQYRPVTVTIEEKIQEKRMIDYLEKLRLDLSESQQCICFSSKN
ncbi:MAG: hypothetical protein IPL50_12345 [Chitinophagaceae bacterium]|nr:hypothetical protein [Chitinophagaceae bacterium]